MLRVVPRYEQSGQREQRGRDVENPGCPRDGLYARRECDDEKSNCGRCRPVGKQWRGKARGEERDESMSYDIKEVEPDPTCVSSKENRPG